jgi:hypothetical protein
MMFSKDLLASKILNEDIEDYSTLLTLSRSKDYPQFEVRTIGSAGTVQIRFPNQGWIAPREWANNHATTIARNLISDIERLKVFGTPERPLNEMGYFTVDQVCHGLRSHILEDGELLNELTVPDEAYGVVNDQLWDNLRSILYSWAGKFNSST